MSNAVSARDLSTNVERFHRFPVVIAAKLHPIPSRTRKLSSPAPMVLHGRPCGRVGRRRIFLGSPRPYGRGLRLFVRWKCISPGRSCIDVDLRLLYCCLSLCDAFTVLRMGSCALMHPTHPSFAIPSSLIQRRWRLLLGRYRRGCGHWGYRAGVDEDCHQDRC